jgi:hypothetical protein
VIHAEEGRDCRVVLGFRPGHRRYQTILEGVVEFTIVERLTDLIDGWEEALGRERREFQRTQLRPGIRSDRETARRMRRELN